MLKLDPLKMLIYTVHRKIFKTTYIYVLNFLMYLLKQLNWKLILIHLFVSILINNN